MRPSLELPVEPVEGDGELARLELADGRGGLRRRQSGARREDPREEGGEAGASGEELPRRRAALEREAARPADEVEFGRREGDEVPVHEDGAAVERAEVVAAHVEVDDG